MKQTPVLNQVKVLTTKSAYERRMPSDESFSCVAQLKKNCEPCTLVVPSSLSSNNKFLSAIDPKFSKSDSRPNTSIEPVDLTTGNSQLHVENNGDPSLSDNSSSQAIANVAASEIQLKKAIQICSLLSTLSMPPNISAEDKWSFLYHIFEARDTAIRATGGLLSFCLHRNILLKQGDVEDLICVNAIKYGTVIAGMQMSNMTAKALQVFQDEAHPAGRGVGRAKEGISAFGLIRSYVKSAPATRLLRDWFRCPLTETDEIGERQLLVAAFRKPANHSFRYNIQDALRSVRNVPGILNRIRNFSAKAIDWEALLNSVRAFVIVIETLKSTARSDAAVLNTKLYHKLNEVDVEELRSIITWIEGVIDFEESQVENRICVKNGFSEEVDEIRYCLAGMDDFLTKVGVEEMKSIMENPSDGISLNRLSFTYLPNIGFLATLDHSDVERIGLKDLECAGYELMFSSKEQGQFFKSAKCRELDEKIGDARGSLIDLEAKVIRFLENKVVPMSHNAHIASSIVSQIDCFQAIAAAADEYNWNQPTILNDAEGIRIENGRHALLELGSFPFVANPTDLRCGDVHVVTGYVHASTVSPVVLCMIWTLTVDIVVYLLFYELHRDRPNFSGKSVYLKQVALIMILAQVGSCVPADSAVLRPVKAIQARISSGDAISQGQSTFFLDCAQIASMLQGDKYPVLLLIDEFGKGTSEIDGVALLAATLRDVLNRPENEFMCLCATHQIEIFENNILPKGNHRLGTYSLEMLEIESEGTEEGTGKTTKRAGRSLSESGGNMSTSEEHRGYELNNQIGYIRTYRLLQGTICSDSRALQCALEMGISREILTRAAQLRTSLSSETRSVLQVRWLDLRVRLCVQETQGFMQLQL